MLRRGHAAGIEISANDVKLVVLRRDRQGWAALTAVSERLPEGVMAGDAIRDPAALAEVLTRLRRQLPSRFTRVHVAVSGGVVVMRRVRMPAMSPAAVKKTIRLQTDQYLSMGSTEGAASYVALPDGPDSNNLSVLMLGTAQHNLNALAGAFRTASMRLAGLTAPALALGRLAAAWETPADPGATPDGGQPAPPENTAVVLVQEEAVSAFVFRHGVPMVARPLTNGASGGRDVMMELRQSLMIDSRPPARLILLGDPPPEWFALLRSLFSAPTSASAPVVRSSVPIVVGPPMPADLPPGFAVPAGLAMAALAQDHKRDLNLLRPQLRMRAPRPWLWPAVAMGASLVLLAATGAFWYVQGQQIAARRAQVSAQLPPPVAQPAGADIAAQYQPAMTRLKQAVTWSSMVADLNRWAPSGLQVLNISGGTEAVAVEGQSAAALAARITVTGTAATREQINAYIAALRTSGRFVDVSLRTVRAGQAGTTGAALTFDLTATLTGGGSGS